MIPMTFCAEKSKRHIEKHKGKVIEPQRISPRIACLKRNLFYLASRSEKNPYWGPPATGRRVLTRCFLHEPPFPDQDRFLQGRLQREKNPSRRPVFRPDVRPVRRRPRCQPFA